MTMGDGNVTVGFHRNASLPSQAQEPERIVEMCVIVRLLESFSESPLPPTTHTHTPPEPSSCLGVMEPWRWRLPRAAGLREPCVLLETLLKKGCATHTAGMSCMQSIESVSSGRQRRGEVGSSLEEPGCNGGLATRGGVWKRWSSKLTSPPPLPPSETDFSINLFLLLSVGNDQWRSITVVWSLADERRGWGEVRDGAVGVGRG